VDVIVTEYGASVNPLRQDLRDKLAAAGVPLRDIRDLRLQAESLVGKSDPMEYKDKVVGIVTYRDGSVIDLIRQVA
jgi:citrate lyase subunit alpha/citrate CoA-transferase